MSSAVATPADTDAAVDSVLVSASTAGSSAEADLKALKGGVSPAPGAAPSPAVGVKGKRCTHAAACLMIPFPLAFDSVTL